MEKAEIKLNEKEVSQEGKPVRSLVEVCFQTPYTTLTYYNDAFDLHPGDTVYVSGKLEGSQGTVVTVTTKFKIHLSDYEKILAAPQLPLHGTFEPLTNTLLACDEDSLTVDAFRAWALPSRNFNSEDVILGDGYSIDLDQIETSEEVRELIIERAHNYCEEERVLFLNVKDGVGTAFVHGTKMYEVSFKLAGRQITDLYCDCPYTHLCKHSLATLFMLKGILKTLPEDRATGFTCISQRLFWNEIQRKMKSIRII